MRRSKTIITVSGLARLLGVSRARVHQLVSSGAIVPEYVSADDRGSAYYWGEGRAQMMVEERKKQMLKK